MAYLWIPILLLPQISLLSQKYAHTYSYPYFVVHILVYVWHIAGHMSAQVEVEAEVDGWLHCVSASGAKGLVPATYVRMLAPGEHAQPLPASPPARGHSRQLSYDFFSQVCWDLCCEHE